MTGPTALLEILRRHAENPAQRVTFVDAGREDGAPFRELLDLAPRMAVVLDRLGVRSGDVLPMLLGSERSFLVAFLGALWLGAIPACLPKPGGGARERARSRMALGSLAARHALVPAGVTADEIPSGVEAVSAQDLLERCAGVEARALTPPSDRCHVAFLQFSSGTSGTPKKLAITRDGLVNNLAGIERANRFEVGQCMVSWLPLFHDMGLVGGLLSPLFAGMSVALLQPEDFVRDPLSWMKAIHRFGGTATVAPNFAFALCAKYGRKLDPQALDLSRMRVAVNGSETIMFASVAAFLRCFAPSGLRPDIMAPAYGLAENTLAVSISPTGRPLKTVGLDRRALQQGIVRRAAGPEASVFLSAGPPFAATPCLIVDDDHRPLPAWTIGRIAIGGACLAEGIPLASIGGSRWFDTGDLGFLDDDGEIYVTGRASDVINCGGEKYFPDEIEAVAAETGVCRAGRVIAFGAADAERGTQRLVLAADVQTAPSIELVGELRDALLRRFGLALSDIVFLERGSVPVTTSGKLQRSRVRSWYERGEPIPGELARAVELAAAAGAATGRSKWEGRA